MSTKNSRPSSPRRFFARIYGHLESKDDDFKSTKTKPTDIYTPEDLTVTDETREKTETNEKDSRSRLKRLNELNNKDKNTQVEVENPKILIEVEDDDEEKEKNLIDRSTQRLGNVTIPFLPHGLFPGSPTHPLHLTHAVHPVSMPTHLHSLAGHPADAHFHGFSAFRKFNINLF